MPPRVKKKQTTPDKNRSELDILSVDAAIKEEFTREYTDQSKLKEQLSDLSKTLTKNLPLRTQKTIQNNITTLQDQISTIDSQYNLNFYIAESAHILEKYKQILKTPIKINFMSTKEADSSEKDSLIADYLNIVKKYITKSHTNIADDIYRAHANSHKKSSLITTSAPKVTCNNDLCKNKTNFDIIDNSVYICLLCGSQQIVSLHTSSFKDIDRINISTKYQYDRKVHFRDCINQYQGKQNSTIDEKILIDLDDQFERHHLLPKVTFRDKTPLKFPNKARYITITKEIIHIFLKELGYTKHYENVNLIHYLLTDIKPDNISHLEDRLLDDFDLLTAQYDKTFKNREGYARKNFINTHYVLYQFLMRYKHQCKKEDFTMLKTVDRQTFHDSVSAELFIALEWSITPLY